MASKPFNAKQAHKRLEELTSARDKIRETAKPLRDKLVAEWSKVEKARLAYNGIKKDVLPELHKIEAPLKDLCKEINMLSRVVGGGRGIAANPAGMPDRTDKIR